MKRQLIALALLIALIFAITTTNAEPDFLTPAWVLCQPDSYINVRTFPKKASSKSGYLLTGDRIFVNGVKKGNYIHCAVSNEYGEGWVYKGYIVYSEPFEDGHIHPIMARGRVAARRTVDGTRRCWLHNGDTVLVHMISDEWCLTDRGFVKTQFIDLSTRFDIEENMNPLDMTWEED